MTPFEELKKRTTTLHPEEDIFEALMERFRSDLELLKRWWETSDGRRAFSMPLTDEEEYARFRNGPLRLQKLEEIRKEEGPAAARRWLDRMLKLDRKLGLGE
mgnify:CR=1 FL=1